MKKLILLLISILILLIIGCCIFRYVKFAEGVNKDVETRFNVAKDYIHGISFEGVIIKKYETESKEYSIDIALGQIDSLPTMSQKCTLLPYFQFENDTLLRLSIPYDIYKHIRVFDFIAKQANSDYLKIENNTFLLLSSSNKQWFASEEDIFGQNSSLIANKTKALLENYGYRYTEDLQKAGYILQITATTRKAGEENGIILCYADIIIKLTDNYNDRILYANEISEKGFAILAEQAGRNAFEKAALTIVRILSDKLR